MILLQLFTEDKTVGEVPCLFKTTILLHDVCFKYKIYCIAVSIFCLSMYFKAKKHKKYIK